MSRLLPCGACGQEGYAETVVAFRIVEIPEDERRQVNVFIPDPGSRTGGTLTVEAPERYVREPRCRDTKACAERVAAFELAALAVAPPAPDPVSPAPVTVPPVEEEPEWRL